MTLPALLSIALVIDALFGEPRWLWQRLPHLVVLMGRLIDSLTRALNRNNAKKAKGCAFALGLVVLGIALGVLISRLGPAAEILLAAILLAHRSLIDHVKAVSDGLRLSLAQGRRSVARIVSRDTRGMNRSDIARSAIESAAENLSDGVIAPAFWFLVAGLPGLIVYKLINTADSMVGYRNAQYAEYGWASARLDDLLNLIPARLTAALILTKAGLWPQLGEIRTDARQHTSPNAGWPEAAMARALNVALSGPRTYEGVERAFAWINQAGRKELSARDIDAALRHLWSAWILMLSITALTALVTLSSLPSLK
ncbi:MAG: adenosylcobinamide-phosphate synthase CbiB [Pseudomonadota bacterium]